MSYRAKVRMYRHGLGDCFLISLPRTDSDAPYYIMIDCGVILGTADPVPLMQKVVKDIAQVTGGHVDLLIGTHEHWDHLSGFVQAKDELAKITFDQVWLAWTEDPKDPLAKRIAKERSQAVAALTKRAVRLRAFGAAAESAEAADVESILSFFGPGDLDPGALGAAGGTTKDALENLRGLGKNVSYRSPGADPVTPKGTNFRLYVLGPPRDEKALMKINPSKAHPETYGIALSDVPFGLAMGDIAPGLMIDDAAPFDAMQAIPMSDAQPEAQKMDFFQKNYFGAGAEAWRTIGSTFLDGSSEFALALDSATNNSCLVLAIELADGDVLLFPADAQVGNWLSWQTLSWKVDGKDVTGPDLLGRCVLYKVGHHGSHNATLKEHGLELMEKLGVAMIPVNVAMAVKKRWTKMPLKELVAALDEKASKGVIQADKDAPNNAPVTAKSDLFYEVTL
jgi:hypothetical protein